jgi:iron complex transport system substrate-binding protein
MTVRRAVAALVAALTLATLATACGSDDDATRAAGTDATAHADEGAFPVTIEHEFGSTTIEARPERVVVVGFNEQDTLLALGVRPVGTREWFGEKRNAVWPWAEDAMGDAKATVLPSSDIDPEQVAALRPDLIVGIYAGLTEDQYDKLSQIAPVLPQSKEFIDYGMPWQDVTLMLGTAVGEPERARQIVDDLEARFAEIREAHPEFRGKQAVVGTAWDADIYAYASQDGRGRLLQSLGFTIPPEVDEIAGDEFTATVSSERTELFDLDALIWITDSNNRDRLSDIPVFANLDVVRDGRVVYFDNDETDGAALSWNTPLSLPYFLDILVPKLADALS